MKTKLCIALLAASSGAVFGQAAPKPPAAVKGDPYVKGEPVAPEDPFDQTHQVGALVEYVQLDARAANKLVRKHAASLSAKLLREELETMIDEGTAELIESIYGKTRSGQRVSVQSIDEMIYPTEYDPPEIPQTVTLDASTAPGTAANPTAFEMRPVGVTLEFDPIITQDGKRVEMNIAPSFVRFLGREYTLEDREGLTVDSPKTLSSTIYQPKFYSITQQTAVTVRDGDTMLLSLNRPDDVEDKMVMVLLRVDIVK